jgi:hypothetical protein
MLNENNNYFIVWIYDNVVWDKGCDSVVVL